MPFRPVWASPTGTLANSFLAKALSDSSSDQTLASSLLETPLGSPHSLALWTPFSPLYFSGAPVTNVLKDFGLLFLSSPSLDCELLESQAGTAGPLGWVCSAYTLASQPKWLNICLLHE